jgi:hypothetical protein
VDWLDRRGDLTPRAKIVHRPSRRAWVASRCRLLPVSIGAGLFHTNYAQGLSGGRRPKGLIF